MNKNPIKCSDCGKFISYKDIDDKLVYTHFIPDTEYTVEGFIFVCKKCIDKYGIKTITGYYE